MHARVTGICGLAVALLVSAGPVLAAGEDELTGLINAYRAEARSCAGERLPATGALVPVPALASVRMAGGQDLGVALKAAGYPAAAASVISVSGPPSAAAALLSMKDRYCRDLLDARWAEIGVARQGDTWRVVMARPLLADDLGDWQAAGKEVLKRVNAARSSARRCGDRSFAAVGPLTWSPPLAEAALAHSRDMAERNYFDHVGPQGGSAAQRATRAGYAWKTIGENIAAGQGAPEQVVAGWLASPGHCANIMDADFAEMGAAYATHPGSDRFVYWTQVFGRR